MKIKVDFFKESGKWYSGGEVEIGEARLWHGEPFRQAIVDHQEILEDGWQGGYHVVTGDLPEFDTDPNYHEFSIALLSKEKFIGVRRRPRQSDEGLSAVPPPSSPTTG
jgi:hypothetical protein